MRIAVPTEVKNNEFRVAITPVGVHELVRRGHEVYIQKGAGVGSSISDEEYVAQGAKIVSNAADTWEVGEMVIKVKEPISSEYQYLREDLTLFTYLHLAADRPQTDALLKAGTTSIAYETVQLPSGALPLLYPMSEIAGSLAPQVGAHALMKAQGGRGVLMGCIGGVPSAKVVVLGGGVAGQNAANIAMGLGADVTVLDTDLDKLEVPQPGTRCRELRPHRARARPPGRSGGRHGAHPRREGPETRHQRHGRRDEARIGAGGCRHRPGRLLRGFPPDHP